MQPAKAHLIADLFLRHRALAVDNALAERVLYHQRLFYTLRVVKRHKAKAAGDASLIGNDHGILDVAKLLKVLPELLTRDLSLHETQARL